MRKRAILQMIIWWHLLVVHIHDANIIWWSVPAIFFFTLNCNKRSCARDKKIQGTETSESSFSSNWNVYRDRINSKRVQPMLSMFESAFISVNRTYCSILKIVKFLLIDNLEESCVSLTFRVEHSLTGITSHFKSIELQLSN